MEILTMNNILTIIAMAVGFVIQYVAIVTKFSERITKLETKYDAMKEALDKSEQKSDKDISSLFHMVRNILQSCEHTREVSHD